MRSKVENLKSGFTLIEMLVVVSLIVFLISILLPAMSKTKEKARITVCQANLKGYGIGFVSYSADNARGVMKIVEQWGGRPYPNYIRRGHSPNGEWSIESIKGYADGISDDSIYGIAICPAIDGGLMQKFVQVRNIGSNHNFFEFQYTYWGRVDRLDFNDYTGDVQTELTRRILRPDRIIMSDIVYWDQSDRAWRYNHGNNGWAFNEYSWMPWDRGDPPDITGTNQVLGDGSVRWKKEEDFPYINLMSEPATYPGGALGNRGGNGDTFYY